MLGERRLEQLGFAFFEVFCELTGAELRRFSHPPQQSLLRYKRLSSLMKTKVLTRVSRTCVGFSTAQNELTRTSGFIVNWKALYVLSNDSSGVGRIGRQIGTVMSLHKSPVHGGVIGALGSKEILDELRILRY